MIRLSERLNKIAKYVGYEEDIGDIGTDHGYLPLYLLEKNPRRKAIFCDINPGPLKKTESIIRKECPQSNPEDFDLRLGNGLEPLENNEVDAVVIAGMGGILIKEILEKDLDKTRSFNKIIVQPRTAADKLRRWLVERELFIADEDLAEEKRRFCEIIVIEPSVNKINTEFGDDLDYRFSPILSEKKIPLVRKWLEDLIRKESLIKKSIESRGNSDISADDLDRVNKKLEKLEMIVGNM